MLCFLFINYYHYYLSSHRDLFLGTLTFKHQARAAAREIFSILLGLLLLLLLSVSPSVQVAHELLSWSWATRLPQQFAAISPPLFACVFTYLLSSQFLLSPLLTSETTFLYHLLTVVFSLLNYDFFVSSGEFSQERDNSHCDLMRRLLFVTAAAVKLEQCPNCLINCYYSSITLNPGYL